MRTEEKNNNRQDKEQKQIDVDLKNKVEQTGSQYMSDKGDMGKNGSMQEQFSSEEGFRTMDEDEV